MSDIDTRSLEHVLLGSVDPEIIMLEARIRAAQCAANITIGAAPKKRESRKAS